MLAGALLFPMWPPGVCGGSTDTATGARMGRWVGLDRGPLPSGSGWPVRREVAPRPRDTCCGRPPSGPGSGGGLRSGAGPVPRIRGVSVGGAGGAPPLSCGVRPVVPVGPVPRGTGVLRWGRDRPGSHGRSRESDCGSVIGNSRGRAGPGNIPGNGGVHRVWCRRRRRRADGVTVFGLPRDRWFRPARVDRRCLRMCRRAARRPAGT